MKMNKIGVFQRNIINLYLKNYDDLLFSTK